MARRKAMDLEEIWATKASQRLSEDIKKVFQTGKMLSVDRYVEIDSILQGETVSCNAAHMHVNHLTGDVHCNQFHVEVKLPILAVV